MELGTAGSILSFAIELEAKVLEFYQKSLAKEITLDEKEVLETIRRQHRKISKTLDRMRKENVTEMILEPIHGFQSDDYTLDISDPVDIESILAAAEKLEEILHEFLNSAAKKVSFLPEMSQLLVELGNKNRKNIISLSELR
jgi:hypothetical protein